MLCLRNAVCPYCATHPRSTLAAFALCSPAHGHTLRHHCPSMDLLWHHAAPKIPLMHLPLLPPRPHRVIWSSALPLLPHAATLTDKRPTTQGPTIPPTPPRWNYRQYQLLPRTSRVPLIHIPDAQAPQLAHHTREKHLTPDHARVHRHGGTTHHERHH